MFQFTHPGRGATSTDLSSSRIKGSFNSRTPGGVRLEPNNDMIMRAESFNSRTPGGVRLTANTSLTKLQEFQFTHPGRGATGEPMV